MGRFLLLVVVFLAFAPARSVAAHVHYSTPHLSDPSSHVVRDMPPTVNNTANSVATVDSTSRPGPLISLSLDTNGIPVIAYTDENTRTVKLAVCQNADCTSPHSIVTISSGSDPALTLDSANKPVVSFVDTSGKGVMVARCSDRTCTSPPRITNPDTGIRPGPGTSIVLDNQGYPVLSYHDGKGIRVLHCNDPFCDGADDTTSSYDSSAQSGNGSYSTIRLNKTGLPRVIYSGGNNGDVRLLVCNDANCAGGDDSITYLGPGTTGTLALDIAGNPVIATTVLEIQSPANFGIKVMRCNDPRCQGGDDSIAYPDDTRGSLTSLALRVDGTAVVATSTFKLHILSCGDLVCTKSLSRIAEPSAADGFGQSLVLDAIGNPAVAFASEGTLKVLRCDNPSCGTPSPIGASITGHAFNDLNTNSILDASEPGVPGVQFKLHQNPGGCYGPVVHTLTTGAIGDAVFSNLAPGTYWLEQVTHFDWANTSTPCPTAINLTANQTVLVNFGLAALPMSSQKERRSIIYISGITSRSGCDQSGLLQEAPKWLSDQIKPGANVGPNVVISDVTYFSYRKDSKYCDGGDGSNGATPNYEPIDTCNNTIDGSGGYAEALNSLVQSVRRRHDSKVTIIAHSQGGFITSYLIGSHSQESKSAMASVVLLDSFPRGLPLEFVLDDVLHVFFDIFRYRKICGLLTPPNVAQWDIFGPVANTSAKAADVPFYTLRAENGICSEALGLTCIVSDLTRFDFKDRLHATVPAEDHAGIWTTFNSNRLLTGEVNNINKKDFIVCGIARCSSPCDLGYSYCNQASLGSSVCLTQAGQCTVTKGLTLAGSLELAVVSPLGFRVGDTVIINPGGANQEQARIVGFASLLVAQPLRFTHQPGEPVVKVSGTFGPVPAGSVYASPRQPPLVLIPPPRPSAIPVAPEPMALTIRPPSTGTGGCWQSSTESACK